MKPILLLAVFIAVGSPMAKACEVDMDQVFRDSINRECAQKHVKCGKWSDLPNE